MSDCSKDLINANKYTACITVEAISQCQAFVGKGTSNAAGANIKALNPSMRARPDILSLPAFMMALTTACARPDMRIRIEAVFSTNRCASSVCRRIVLSGGKTRECRFHDDGTSRHGRNGRPARGR